MAAGSIFAGIFGESYHIKDSHSQVGVLLSLGIALLLIFFPLPDTGPVAVLSLADKEYRDSPAPAIPAVL